LLPGALGYARDLAFAGQVAETNAAEVKITDEGTGAAAQGAAVYAAGAELGLAAGFMLFGCS